MIAEARYGVSFQVDQNAGVTYLLALFNLSLDTFDNFVNSSPGVLILSAPSNNAKRLQNIDDIVNAAPFDPELPRALVQQKNTPSFESVVVQETAAKLSQRFFFARVNHIGARGLLGIVCSHAECLLTGCRRVTKVCI